MAPTKISLDDNLFRWMLEKEDKDNLIGEINHISTTVDPKKVQDYHRKVILKAYELSDATYTQFIIRKKKKGSEEEWEETQLSRNDEHKLPWGFFLITGKWGIGGKGYTEEAMFYWVKEFHEAVYIGEKTVVLAIY